MALSRTAMKTLARSAGASTPSMSVAARSQHTMANDKYMQTPEHYQVGRRSGGGGGGTPAGVPSETGPRSPTWWRAAAARARSLGPVGEPSVQVHASCIG